MSAYHFTKGFSHDQVGREFGDDINQSITHLQYGRKSQPQETLDVSRMDRLKNHIDRQVKKFEDALIEEYDAIWKRRSPQQITVLNLATATNATTFANLLLTFPPRDRLTKRRDEPGLARKSVLVVTDALHPGTLAGLLRC